MEYLQRESAKKALTNRYKCQVSLLVSFSRFCKEVYFSIWSSSFCASTSCEHMLKGLKQTCSAVTAPKEAGALSYSTSACTPQFCCSQSAKAWLTVIALSQLLLIHFSYAAAILTYSRCKYLSDHFKIKRFGRRCDGSRPWQHRSIVGWRRQKNRWNREHWQMRSGPARNGSLQRKNLIK